ncbi:hypothetical protein JNJ66_06380 [Candidatus Saccharibacteria bacterium]|nr:hypothetical protein [Candidatus Saccharibacteria bacterium]
MHIPKNLVVAGVATSMGIAGLAAVGTASAMTTTGTSGDNLITKIAEKFNLNQDEVKAVFDEAHEEREAAQKQQVEEALTQAVTDGKLTEDQKQKLLDKRAELQAERQAERTEIEGLSDEDRQTAMEGKREEMDTKRQELQQWLSDNGIDETYGRYLMGGRGGHGGPGSPGGFGRPDGTAQDSGASGQSDTSTEQ